MSRLFSLARIFIALSRRRDEPFFSCSNKKSAASRIADSFSSGYWWACVLVSNTLFITSIILIYFSRSTLCVIIFFESRAFLPPCHDDDERAWECSDDAFRKVCSLRTRCYSGLDQIVCFFFKFQPLKCEVSSL